MDQQEEGVARDFGADPGVTLCSLTVSPSGLTVQVQARNYANKQMESQPASVRLLDILHCFCQDIHARMHYTIYPPKPDGTSTLFHVVFLMETPQLMFGRNERWGAFNEKLQSLMVRNGFTSLLSIAPVDFRKGNLLAEAVLASLDPHSSPKRDKLFDSLVSCRVVHDDFFQKGPRSAGSCSLPEPRKTLALTSVDYQISQKRSSASEAHDPPPYKSQAVLQASAPPFFPSSASRGAPAYYPSSAEYPKAAGIFERSIGELWFTPDAPDLIPGTPTFDALMDEILLKVPDWIDSILNYEIVAPHGREPYVAELIRKNSMAFCLKILGEAMLTCAKALFHASKAVMLAIQSGVDTLNSLYDDLDRASQACLGVEPVLEGFCGIKTPDLNGSGVVPETLPINPEELSIAPVLPALFAGVPEVNQIKKLYKHLFLAYNWLVVMQPDCGFVVCWDRILRQMREVKQAISLARSECHRLMHDM